MEMSKLKRHSYNATLKDRTIEELKVFKPKRQYNGNSMWI